MNLHRRSHPVKHRLSYASVTATLALMLAVGRNHRRRRAGPAHRAQREGRVADRRRHQERLADRCGHRGRLARSSHVLLRRARCARTRPGPGRGATRAVTGQHGAAGDRRSATASGPETGHVRPRRCAPAITTPISAPATHVIFGAATPPRAARRGGAATRPHQRTLEASATTGASTIGRPRWHVLQPGRCERLSSTSRIAHR